MKKLTSVLAIFGSLLILGSVQAGPVDLHQAVAQEALGFRHFHRGFAGARVVGFPGVAASASVRFGGGGFAAARAGFGGAAVASASFGGFAASAGFTRSVGFTSRLGFRSVGVGHYGAYGFRGFGFRSAYYPGFSSVRYGFNTVAYAPAYASVGVRYAPVALPMAAPCPEPEPIPVPTPDVVPFRAPAPVCDPPVALQFAPVYGVAAVRSCGVGLSYGVGAGTCGVAAPLASFRYGAVGGFRGGFRY